MQTKFAWKFQKFKDTLDPSNEIPITPIEGDLVT